MNKLTVGTSPHIQSSASVRRIMLDVLVALVPALTASVLFFGWRALVLAAIAVATSFLAEFIFYVIRNASRLKKAMPMNTAFDCSCFVTGMLVALNVPVTLPIWMLMLGCVFAIVIVKMLFGGIGKNFANPAMAARVFLLLSFATAMSATATNGWMTGGELVSSPTWLANRDPALVRDGWLYMLVGNKASAAMGEVSIIALVLGYLYLSIRKVIDFRTPLVLISAAAVFAFLFDGLKHKGADMFYVTLGHVLNGGLFLGAIFMATDYATSPNTRAGMYIFCIGIALLTVVIRVYTPYPEGMSFAILLMNILTPVIDKAIVPKPFGYKRASKRIAVPVKNVLIGVHDAVPSVEHKNASAPAETAVEKPVNAVDPRDSRESTKKTDGRGADKTAQAKTSVSRVGATTAKKGNQKGDKEDGR